MRHAVLVLLISFILVQVPSFGVYDITWKGQGGDWLWTNSLNWLVTSTNEHDTPWPTDDTRIERVDFDPAYIAPTDNNSILINQGMGLVTCGQLVMGYSGGGKTFCTVDGGMFNPGYLRVGGAADSIATFEVKNEGYVNVAMPDGQNGMIFIGDSEGIDQGWGIMNVYSGSVDVRYMVRVGSSAHFVDTNDPAGPIAGTKGVLNLYGGSLSVGGPILIFPADTSTFMPQTLPYAPGGSGRVNFTKGVLKFAGFDPVTAGQVIDRYVKDKRITAYDGHPRATIHHVFDANIYKTVVWATIDDNFKTAYNPFPADGATGQVRFVTFKWEAGEEANAHDVYLGTTLNDVNTATAALPVGGIYKGRQALANKSFDPGILQIGVKYYWRIDEVSSTGTVTKGKIWSFTVAPNFLIESFETYKEVNDVNVTWTRSGGVSTDLLTSVPQARSGANALAFTYSNAAAPYYSQATLTLPKAVNVTLDNSKFMAFYFHGSQTNTKDPFYVRFEDASGAISPKVLFSGDMNDITEAQWKPWSKAFNVVFSNVSGVNLASLKKIHVGLGNGTSAGGSGTIKLDDITVFAPSCIYPLKGDLTSDCNVNCRDYALFAADYGKQGYNVVPQTPPAPRLWYKFDETSGTTAADSSGNGYNGTLQSLAVPWDTAGGKNGGCIKLNLVGSQRGGVIVPKAAFSTINNQMSVAVWVKGDANKQPPAVGAEQYIFYFGYGTSAGETLDSTYAAVPLANGDVLYSSGDPETGALDNVTWRPETGASAWSGTWNHYAFTKNAVTGKQCIYLNGIPVAQSTTSTDTLGEIYSNGILFWIGSANGSSWGGYQGRLDDFRLYNVELTQEQIASLVGGTVHQPAPKTDISKDDVVNFKDLDQMLDNWVNRVLFPAE